MSNSDDRHYRLLVESVVDFAIYMLDPTGIVTSWNIGAEKIKGYTAAEIIGKHFSTFYTPESRAEGRPQLALTQAAETGRFEDEAWRQRKDGTRFWALVVIDAIRGEDGELIGFAKITRDMTERRAAQQALLETERRFRILVEGVTDYAIYMLDPEGKITNWNTGAQRAKGYTTAEILGHNFSRFYTEEDRAVGMPERALDIARREGRFEAEGQRVRKDGSRFWAHVIIDPIRDDDGVLIGFAKVTRDITERRETQRRLEEAREQLFQAQKLEALGQLTGGLAHDFNNLLTAILGGAELGLRRNDPVQIHGLLNTIRGAAERGSHLTRQLLAFARRQPLEPASIVIDEFLASTLALLSHSMTPEIELVQDLADPVWPVDADPGQLELAILNLGFNARDAMPAGGRLTISARNAPMQGEISDLTGEFVAISVSDTGAGIPAGIIDRVVEPFFTTKAFGQGTGLGLSQVYGFARQSGGAMVIKSPPGQGSVITLYLPAGRSQADRENEEDRHARILVVEDDAAVADLAAQLIEDMGYAPQVVHSAHEALAMLDRQGAPDLVFSDIVMPGGLSGLELARRVRERFPELPILLTTGYSSRLADAPAEFPIVPKPYQYEVLQKALDELLA